MQLRNLGAKNIEVGVGCGVGFGHGFGVGMPYLFIICINSLPNVSPFCDFYVITF